MALVTDGKAGFAQNLPCKYRDCCSGNLQWGRDCPQFQIQPGQVGIYSQEQGRGAAGGELLRRNIRAKGGCERPT